MSDKNISKPPRNLTIRRETLRRLSNPELAFVIGGMQPMPQSKIVVKLQAGEEGDAVAVPQDDDLAPKTCK